MNTSISISMLSDNLVQITTIIDDKLIKNECERPQKIWDMSEVVVPKRFELNKKQNFQFEDALNSKQGFNILNQLKNETTDSFLNRFLYGVAKNINPKGKLSSFIKDLIKQPLVGKNQLYPYNIGLTKKEIYQQFVKQGLIKA